MRTVILSASSSSGTFTRTKVRISPNNARRESRYQLTAGGGEGGGQDSYEFRLFPVALPRLPPKGYMRLLVLMVDDEMCFFLDAAQRQTSRLTACAESFALVCKSS